MLYRTMLQGSPMAAAEIERCLLSKMADFGMPLISAWISRTNEILSTKIPYVMPSDARKIRSKDEQDKNDRQVQEA